MKIAAAAVASLACVQYSAAFVGPQFASRALKSSLNGHATSDGEVPGWAVPVSTFVAGLTVAAQSVGASVDVPVVPMTPAIEIANAGAQHASFQSSAPSAISGSSFALSANNEYLDFSMPSYGSSIESTSKAKAEAPSFANPFEDFDFNKNKVAESAAPAAEKSEEKVDAAAEAAKKAEKEKAEKEAAEKKKEEEKAAEERAKADKDASEQKKAEEKAAKEAEKEAAKKEAEEKAAAEAKKAEKEARRQAELEKQRAAVERQKEQEAAAKAESAPVPAPVPVAPKPAEVKAPEFKAPDIPEFKAPDIKLDIPSFKAPDVKIPSFSMPKIDMSSGGDGASISLPKAPSVSLPKLDVRTEIDEDIEPQEVRDERARAARSVYKDADEKAKDLEAKAAQLRQVANDKKRLAKEAKEEACKTRVGGKVLCIRPLNSGY